MITVSYGMVLDISDAIEREKGRGREGGRERDRERGREREKEREWYIDYLDDPIPYERYNNTAGIYSTCMMAEGPPSTT